jgi:cobalt-zinc-cadmium efflux system membrane fusion protein
LSAATDPPDAGARQGKHGNMIGRIGLVFAALLVGIAAASFIPPLSNSVRHAIGFTTATGSGRAAPKDERQSAGAEADKAAVVKLAPAQIAAAGIDLAPAAPGILTRRITAAGTIVPHADRIARVSVKLSGTVAELRKKIGDPVAQGEIIAVLESREVADAKSEYLAARLTDELQQDLFVRDKALWERRVSSEQQFIRSRNQAAQTRMRLDIARQKLVALGLGEREISALPSQPEAMLRRQDVRSPIAAGWSSAKLTSGVRSDATILKPSFL